jgi:hypothetical protein
LFAQTFDDANVKELIHDMRIGLSASEISMDDDVSNKIATGELFQVSRRVVQTDENVAIEPLKHKFQERLLQIVKTTGRNITIPFGFVVGKILRDECEAWGFGKTSKDALNGNGGCVMRVAVLPTRDKTQRMRFRQVKEGELMSAMDCLHARDRRKSTGSSSGGGF